MFDIYTHTTSTQAVSRRNTLRARSAAFAAAAVALAVAITGFTAPAALAAQAGDYLQSGRLDTEGQFDQPYGLAVDDADNVYVTDLKGDRVRKFDATGKPVHVWGSSGIGNMEFNSPTSVAARGAGDPIYVVDNGNNRVLKFSPDGKIALGNWGGLGIEPGKFDQPSAAAIDSVGNVYVTDTMNNRVQKFDAKGVYLGEWGTLGDCQSCFDKPFSIAIDSQDNVYVSDFLNQRIVKTTSSGVFIREWNQGAGGAKLQRVFSLAVDGSDNLYAVEQASKTVQKFNSDGIYLSTWGNQSGGTWYSSYSGGLAGHVAVNSQGQGFAADTDRVNTFRQATPAVFTSGLNAIGVVGKPYSSQLGATGFPAVSDFTVVTGQLPPGLQLVGNTVSGVPTKTGSYKVTLRANNWLTPFTEKTYTISVTAPPVVSATKVASKLSVRLSTKYPKVRRTNVKATIRLYAPSGISKTGKIRMYYGKKRIKTYTMRSSHKGIIRVTMPKFTKKGKTKVTFRYLGNTRLKAASRAVYVRVR